MGRTRLHCQTSLKTAFPGTGDTYFGYTSSDGRETAESSFNFDKDYYGPGEDLVGINNLSWHTGTGETWSTSSESAAKRIANEMYEISMDIVENTEGVQGDGYAQF